MNAFVMLNIILTPLMFIAFISVYEHRAKLLKENKMAGRNIAEKDYNFIFKSSRTRRDIWKEITEKEYNLKELQNKLGISTGSLTFNLKVLFEAGLIKKENIIINNKKKRGSEIKIIPNISKFKLMQSNEIEKYHHWKEEQIKNHENNPLTKEILNIFKTKNHLTVQEIQNLLKEKGFNLEQISEVHSILDFLEHTEKIIKKTIFIKIFPLPSKVGFNILNQN